MLQEEDAGDAFCVLEGDIGAATRKPKRTKICMIKEKDLLDFIVHQFGSAFCDGNTGKPIALGVWNENDFVGFRSVQCLLLNDCNCTYIRQIMVRCKKNYESNQLQQTGKYLNNLSFRNPRVMAKQTEEIKKLKTIEKFLREKILQLENDVSYLRQQLLEVVVIKRPEFKKIIEQFRDVLENDKLKPNDFLFRLIRTQLLCLNLEDCRAFRWREFDESIVHWALTLRFYGGSRIIDLLRGRSTEGMGSHGKLSVNASDWGLFIPPNSTLGSYLPYVDVESRITDELIRTARDNLLTCTPHPLLNQVIVGIIEDEMEIRR
eukprot:Pompholyxophrys_punicea_v1_NODE_145_length_3208_cov_8.838884.p2 type:complete len:319 gc:universal NODE_145_length_3208_cov_8.838884:3157-2201(-)